jgi:hypothetical protein
MVDEPKISAVYFLVDESESLVKIGHTVDVERRLRELQTANGRMVHYLGWIPGGVQEEQEIHRSMVRYHVRGEWYRLEHGIRRLIDGACAAHRMHIDAEEERDLVSALESTHAIVCGCDR